MDNTHNIQEFKDKIRKFCDDRDWDQFHNPKELAIALNIESAELLELFRWKNVDEIKEVMKNKREDVEDELADILYFLIRIAQMEDIDLSTALDKKMEKNGKKYPVEKFKGSSKKYNELT